MKIGTIHQTELQKLPEELVIPSDQIKLLDSIGQGEPGVYIGILYLQSTAIVCMWTCLVLYSGVNEWLCLHGCKMVYVYAIY